MLCPEEGEEGGAQLVYLEIPFTEDIRPAEFPSLPRPSQQQLDTVDELIDTVRSYA